MRFFIAGVYRGVYINLFFRLEASLLFPSVMSWDSLHGAVSSG